MRREDVTAMTAVPLVGKPRGLLRRYAWRYSRKQFGKVVEPVRAQAHHGGVLMASGAVEMAVARSWKALDPHLRWLALQATSAAIGCSWCVDFGYFEGMQTGVDPGKVRDVAHWHDSDIYDERERALLAYCEAVNATPAQVGADVTARLREHFSDKEIVELAGWVALENYRSRFNAGLGLTSEGFSANCPVPLATAS